MASKKLYGEFKDTTCCGLTEVHTLSAEYTAWRESVSQDLRQRGHAYFATTIPRQKEVIAALRRHGFKAKGSFRNSSTGNTVTIWIKVPTKRKKKK
jgi:hypothetical protein